MRHSLERTHLDRSHRHARNLKKYISSFLAAGSVPKKTAHWKQSIWRHYFPTWSLPVEALRCVPQWRCFRPGIDTHVFRNWLNAGDNLIGWCSKIRARQEHDGAWLVMCSSKSLCRRSWRHSCWWKYERLLKLHSIIVRTHRGPSGRKRENHRQRHACNLDRIYGSGLPISY